MKNLTGSKKQIKWATEIIKEMSNFLSISKPEIEKIYADTDTDPEYFNFDEFQKFSDFALMQDSASWWIKGFKDIDTNDIIYDFFIIFEMSDDEDYDDTRHALKKRFGYKI